MKRLLSAIALLIGFIGLSQTGINYKALIKDDGGAIVANQTVDAQFIIYEGAALTNNVYQESHTTNTDANGIIIVNIGEGTTTDVFGDIAWEKDEHWFNVQVDTGTGLVDMGTTQFMAVPYALNVTGLETLDEGNGIGRRLKGVDPDFYGDIGLNAVDISVSDELSSTYGATALNATALGSNTTASGNISFAAGRDSRATGVGSIAMGVSTLASGNRDVAIGDLTSATGNYSLAMGRNTYASGTNSSAFGHWTKSLSFAETVFGRYNTVYSPLSANTWNSNDRLFVVGNGEDFASLSDAFMILKNGTITAPSFDLAEITDDKALITKEYADNNLVSSGLEAVDEGNGIGYRIKARNPNNFNNIGSGAIDLSLSIFAGNGATGTNSITFGVKTIASGFYSTAMGDSTEANGFYSTAMGLRTLADAINSTAIGRYNVGGGANSVWNPLEPLFEIGNGSSDVLRSNALTVLKNGKIGIGVANPDSALHVLHGTSATSDGFKLESNGASGNWWRFYTPNGSADLNLFSKSQGTTSIGNFNDVSGVYTATSDRRLKKNFKELYFNWEDFMNLETLTYQYKAQKDNETHIGFVAQDVATIYPELVNYNIDSDVYQLNYSGFGVVAIKAIQEQQKIILEQASKIVELEAKLSERETELSSMNSRISRIEGMLSN